MSHNKKNLYLVSIVSSLIGIFFLLTNDFGAWQDQDPFYGVREGFIWIGSEKAFPWAQIGILSISACLLFLAFTSYQGYHGLELDSDNIRKGSMYSRIAVGVTLLFGTLFVLLVWDSPWWWFDTGFYASLVSSGINLWIYRQLETPTN